jgi:GNAT superfamily N-acetyltransferase
MDFRIAEEQDAERIAALHAESWRLTYRNIMPDDFLDGPVLLNRLAVWRERLRERKTGLWIDLALNDTRLIGFACAFGDADPAWGSCIDNLHVLPESHRQGVGAALMVRAANWLCERHPRSGVYLWVMEANEPARRFYKRLGARQYETTAVIDPGGGCARRCRYAWPDPGALLRSVR